MGPNICTCTVTPQTHNRTLPSDWGHILLYICTCTHYIYLEGQVEKMVVDLLPQLGLVNNFFITIVNKLNDELRERRREGGRREGGRESERT